MSYKGGRSIARTAVRWDIKRFLGIVPAGSSSNPCGVGFQTCQVRGSRAMPAVKVHKSKRHKRDRKHRRHTRRHQTRHEVRTPVDRRQSWFGTLSLFFGLSALFLLAVQGIVWFQREQGTPDALHTLMPHVARFEIVAAMIGGLLALLSFPFSSRRKRNAIFGFLLSVGVLA